MRIVLSGGGTGGHITPILAVAAALKRLSPRAELIYIGEGSPMEKALLVEMTNYRILAGKFRRYHGSSTLEHLKDWRTLVLNLKDAFKVFIGFWQSLWRLWRLKPDVVFSKGGYVALPVGLAAAVLRIPLVTHDSDVVPGLTNRILSRFAKARAGGFPTKNRIFTGNPVRDEVLKAKPTSFESSKPVVLITGGSSGATTINQVVFENAAKLAQKYLVIHITGEKGFKYAPHGIADYRPIAFATDEIGGLLAAADVIVGRAGANFIAEFAALGKACVLIPGAHLAGGQQLRNAALIAQKEAALILHEKDLDARNLLKAISSALEHRKAYEQAIKEFHQKDAGLELAKLIVQAK